MPVFFDQKATFEKVDLSLPDKKPEGISNLQESNYIIDVIRGNLEEHCRVTSLVWLVLSYLSRFNVLLDEGAKNSHPIDGWDRVAIPVLGTELDTRRVPS